jgi:hypothetical protein
MFRWSYAVLATIVGGLILLALFHREQPLQPTEIPPAVLQQLQWKHGSAWQRIQYEVDRKFVAAGGGAEMDVTVEILMENLGNGLVRRTDHWRPRNGGGALLYEERYLLYANLLGLVARYREPAPGFHVIFDDHGWLHNKTQSLELKQAPGVPGDPGWDLQAKLVRLDEQLGGDPPVQVTRDVRCVSIDRARNRPVVTCKVSQSDGLQREQRLVYVAEVGLFFLSDYQDTGGAGEPHSATSTLHKFTVDGKPLAL